MCSLRTGFLHFVHDFCIKRKHQLYGLQVWDVPPPLRFYSGTTPGCISVTFHNSNSIFQLLIPIKGVLHLWALFLKTLCIFSKNKATSDKVSYESGQICSKELENYSFTSVETIVVKLQWKMCENQYFACFES